MLDYVPFFVGIWSDKKIQKLTAEQMVLFTYLFANESLTLCGIYELDVELCEHRLKNKMNGKFSEAFKVLVDGEFIKFDYDKYMVWVINRFKILHKMSSSPKIIAGAMKELSHIKHPFKDEFMERYADILHSHIWRLPEKENSIDANYFLDPGQLVELNKFYKSRQALKTFLLRRNCPEQRVDEILAKVLPNLR